MGDLLGSLGGGGAGESNGMGKGASMATATLEDRSTHSTVSGGGQTALLMFGGLVLVVLVLMFRR